jgi:diguanylate cyclase (GGDEF)-like protein
MVYDIILLRRLSEKLNEIAYIDVLTGLPNRTFCEIKLRESGIGKNDLDICCFMFDLNNLKSTNDMLGHTAGDKLIASFANTLKASAPERMFIGRYGGDEFIGILYDATEKEVQLYIHKLLDNVEKVNNEKEVIQISFAYGYAMSSNYNDITIKELLAQADIGMYAHKAKIKH